MINIEAIARIGYEGYAASTGGKTFDGRDMPRWEDLPARTVEAWKAAAEAMLAAHAAAVLA